MNMKPQWSVQKCPFLPFQIVDGEMVEPTVLQSTARGDNRLHAFQVGSCVVIMAREELGTDQNICNLYRVGI